MYKKLANIEVNKAKGQNLQQSSYKTYGESIQKLIYCTRSVSKKVEDLSQIFFLFIYCIVGNVSIELDWCCITISNWAKANIKF